MGTNQSPLQNLPDPGQERGRQSQREQTRKIIQVGEEPLMLVELNDDEVDPRLLKLEDPRHIAVLLVVVVLLALASAIPLCNHFSQPSAWTSQMASLDDKAQVVSGLSGSSVALSAGLSALPGDAGSPIADKLADLSVDFAIVLGAIYIEKYLLTIASLVSLRLIVPLGLLLAGISEACRRRFDLVPTLRSLGVRLIALGAVMVLLVPTSLGLSTMVENAHNLNSTVALEEAQQSAEQVDAEGETTGNQDDEKTILTQVGDMLSSAVNAVTSVATDAIDSATSAFNELLETLVVLIVTTCVIPVLTLILFVTLANLILGTSFAAPTWAGRPRGAALRRQARAGVSGMRHRK